MPFRDAVGFYPHGEEFVAVWGGDAALAVQPARRRGLVRYSLGTVLQNSYVLSQMLNGTLHSHELNEVTHSRPHAKASGKKSPAVQDGVGTSAQASGALYEEKGPSAS
jgi:hypothetical protein